MRPVNPAAFAAANSPYSQAMVAGDLIFVAGQVSFDGANEVVGLGDIAVQTRTVLERLGEVLRSCGATLADVATATVFLTDQANFQEFNRVWKEMFGEHRPARATVRCDLLLEGLLVEVQVIAVNRRHEEP